MEHIRKTVAETYALALDFAAALPEDAVIQSVSASARDETTLEAAPTFLDGSASFDGTIAQVRVEGGTADRVYRVRFTATLDTTDVLEEDVYVRVIP